MGDSIRKVYFGEYNTAASKKDKSKQYWRAYAKATEINKKIADELKSKGVEGAEALAEEWVDAWFNFTMEELADGFKKGVKFGVEFCKELENV